MRRYLILLSALLIALSCADESVLGHLDDVESYIHDDPWRARHELEELSGSLPRSRKVRARYSLLYTMAVDKTDKELKDDSSLLPALEYYRHHGTVDDRIKSLYYLGRYQYDTQQYSKAIVSFTKAYSLLGKSNDERSCGLVNQAIADTYMATFSEEDVIPYLEAAYGCFERYGDKSLADLTLYSMALQLSVLDRYVEADSLYCRIIENGNISKEDLPDVFCGYAINLISASSDDTEKIEELFSKALELSGGKLPDVNSGGAYAYILAKNGKQELAESILDQLMDSDDSQYLYFWKSRVDAMNSDYRSAYLALKESLAFQDSIITVKLQQSSSRAQRDYFALRELQNRIRLRNRSMMFTLIVFVLLLLTVVLSYIFRIRRAAMQAEISEVIMASEIVRHQLENEKKFKYLERARFDREIQDREETLAKLRSDYARIYQRQFKDLGDLCEMFLNAEGRRDSQKSMYNEVKKKIEVFIGDASEQSKFESLLNSRMNDVMSHFRRDFPSFSEEDYRFVSYVLAGFDATTLSVILNMPSQSAVYMKKSRLKKQILSSDLANKDEYLSLF
ncbi:MAG: hypothetical protein NC308_02420 [Clostridium sp.]|nr:hypothetical protein [Bacteroides sp.]MCM1197718.1 hypothetical protein [Clostridium sp.]